MIRKLMASTALLALMSAGAGSVALAADNVAQPAIEQPAAANQNTAADASKKLVPDEPTLATAFIGRSVYSSEDPNSDNIGDVNDLIIGDDGAITDAVVGVGGFLGIGEKNVAVPFDQLKVVEHDGDLRLIYSATKEQLEAAPAFDRTAYDPNARYSAQQTAQTEAQPGMTPAPLAPAPADTMAANPPAATPPVDQQMAAANNEASDEMAAGNADNGFVTFSADQVRATTLMGKDVYGPGDKSIGSISDLVLDQDGKTRVALIDVGGFLGVGQKTVALPFNEIKVSTQVPANGTAADADANKEVRLTVAMTEDQLKQMPEYQAPAQAASTDQETNPAMGADQNAMNATPPAGQTDANGQMITGSVDANTADGKVGVQDLPASQLIGAAVHGTNDDAIGKVNDIVFNADGTIDAVVVDVGGWLGMGEKPVALSFDQLQTRLDNSGNLIVAVNASKDQLENAPTYDTSKVQ